MSEQHSNEARRLQLELYSKYYRAGAEEILPSALFATLAVSSTCMSERYAANG